jgi:hypothetical protein
MTGRPQDRWGVLLLILSGLAVAGMAGLAARTELAKRPRDPVTGCPVAGARGHTLVLLDLTDALTPDQQTHVQERLTRIESEIPRDELLSVWVLGSTSEGALQRVFCRCSPGRQVSWWSDNPRFAGVRDDSLMSRPLAIAVERLSMGREAHRSGIAAAIAEVTGLAEFESCAGPRHLIVVSDLRENSTEWSIYRGDARNTTLKSAFKPAVLHATLRGIPVDMVVIGRAGRPDQEGLLLRDLWKSYLMAAGASSVTFTRL